MVKSQNMSRNNVMTGRPWKIWAEIRLWPRLTKKMNKKHGSSTISCQRKMERLRSCFLKLANSSSGEFLMNSFPRPQNDIDIFDIDLFS
jgi:hypothetical protein